MLWEGSQQAKRASGSAEEIAFWLGVDTAQAEVWAEALSDDLAGFIKKQKKGDYLIVGNAKQIKKQKIIRKVRSEAAEKRWKSESTRKVVKKTKENQDAEHDANALQMQSNLNASQMPRLDQTRLDQTRLNEELNTIAGAIPEPEPEKPSKPVADPDGPTPTALVWRAYKAAFQKRWKKSPPWNAKIAGQLRSFVTRMPAADAPFVAEFYLTHNDAFYVKAMHPVGAMLRDAEKLHVEWQRGSQVTSRDARSAESMGHYQSQLERIARGEL